MRDDRPSTTAAIVAAARGLAGVDPIAADLLPSGVGALVRASAGPGGRALTWGLDALGGGVVRHLALRTDAIDQVLTKACAAGVRQVVLLGTGLDSRPWRLAALRDATVFEVDHPATSAWRQAKSVRIGPALAASRIDVVVNFARDDLRAKLIEAGFDPQQTSAWVWEGVTMYLPANVTKQSLGIISSLAAPGSWLCATYMEPIPWLPEPAKRALHAGFGAVGEPLVGLWQRATFAAELGAHGFELHNDGNGKSWARSWTGRGNAPRASWVFAPERLSVAIRRGIP